LAEPRGDGVVPEAYQSRILKKKTQSRPANRGKGAPKKKEEKKKGRWIRDGGGGIEIFTYKGKSVEILKRKRYNARNCL